MRVFLGLGLAEKKESREVLGGGGNEKKAAPKDFKVDDEF